MVMQAISNIINPYKLKTKMSFTACPQVHQLLVTWNKISSKMTKWEEKLTADLFKKGWL